MSATYTSAGVTAPSGMGACVIALPSDGADSSLASSKPSSSPVCLAPSTPCLKEKQQRRRQLQSLHSYLVRTSITAAAASVAIGDGLGDVDASQDITSEDGDLGICCALAGVALIVAAFAADNGFPIDDDAQEPFLESILMASSDVPPGKKVPGKGVMVVIWLSALAGGALNVKHVLRSALLCGV